MTADTSSTIARDASLDCLAAKLTEAAFPVALRYGVQGSWLDLELELWKTMSETVNQAARRAPHRQSV
jgi:hypothetical protein